MIETANLSELKTTFIASITNLSVHNIADQQEYLLKLCEEIELCFDESFAWNHIPDEELFIYCIFMTLNLMRNELDRYFNHS